MIRSTSRSIAPLLVGLACIALVGCVRAPGGVAPSNIPVAPGSYSELGEVTGRDCKVNLLGIIPISGGNELASAMSRAEKKKSGTDALVGISVDVVSKHFILWSQTCTEVRATAVSLP